MLLILIIYVIELKDINRAIQLVVTAYMSLINGYSGLQTERISQPKLRHPFITAGDKDVISAIPWSVQFSYEASAHSPC